MRRSVVIAVGTLGLALSFADAGEGTAGTKETVWHADYLRARELARQSDLPLFVVFR